MTGKIQVRLAVLAALAAIAALMASAATAQADPMKDLIVDVSPSTVTTLVEEDFTVRITNDPTNNTPLGAVEITSPFRITEGGIAVVGTFDANDEPLAKSWTLNWDGASEVFQLIANSQTDRLDPGEYVRVNVTATPPSQVSDTDYDWLAVGRQANTFNDGVDGNIVLQDLNQGNYTTTVTGTAVNCTPQQQPCSGTQTESQTTVTVSADCGDGILVVDTDLDANAGQIGAAAFYSYFDGACEGKIATVNFAFAKTAELSSPGGLQFAADYDGKDLTVLGHPAYTTGTAFPDCKDNKGIIVNCVDFVKGGSDTISAQVRMVLTDPAGWGFR